ncbi:MAG TPA: AMP-binding protein [Streptosporangiaceae bacterium]|nr:AMP-binding protein [Streptosporangiaceae bacterium]
MIFMHVQRGFPTLILPQFEEGAVLRWMQGGLQTSLSPADHRRAAAGAEHLLGSIGKPAFAVDLRLVDESGKDVARGEVGEIITRSPAVMSGYLAMPSESAQALRDGWFWGGDLAGWTPTATCAWRAAART